MKKLEGKVAIVTGAGRGVGRATALLLAREGASVVVNDLDADVARDCVAEIEANGGKGLVVAGSVTNPALPDELIQTTLSVFG